MSEGAVIVRASQVTPGGGQLRDPGGDPALRNARASWTERRGLILTVRDREGRQGQGEATPLPGYSPDTLDACRRELSALDGGWSAWPAPGLARAQGIDLATVARVAAGVTAPAARFAVETALLDLLGQRLGLPMAELVARLAPWPAARPRARVAVNALIMPLGAADISDALEAISRAHARGVRCFKLKLGADFARELDLLRAVRARFGAGVTLRLDANQAWTARQAADHLARLRDIAPEYVEEPCPCIDDIGDLEGLDAGVPLALDETLATADPRHVEPLLASGRIRALVLKPMVLGLLRCLELAALARAHRALAVTSHLMDGPIALAACAHLALVLGHTCGLDRHPGLDCWPAVELPFLRGAHIHALDRPGLGLELSVP